VSANSRRASAGPPRSELESRALHLRLGHGSLFSYCREVLALSEHEAYGRIEAARAARRFPVILNLLSEGAVNLTSVRLLAPHLTPDNHEALLKEARGKRRVDVETMVARLAPRPDIATSIRRLPASVTATPAARPVSATASEAAGVRPSLSPSAPPAQASAPPPALTSPPRPTVTPLAPDRYRLQVTIGGDVVEKLKAARDLLRHAIPSGDDEAIIDRALTALLENLARQRFAATDRPRPSRAPAPGSRHVPAEVKRAVWLRDLGRCAFVGSAGRRCDERAFLEFHHLRPFAVGGEATAENIELRCRRHNQHEAVAYFRPEAFDADTVREPAGHYASSRLNSFQTELSVPCS
jgi:hypothetical protein